MWLLNCSNYRLESHNSTSPPKYWILSHTWGEDEVTFQDMQDLNVAALKKGFQKIEEMCKLASAKRVKYVWIDTCCIDKTSSAELSESINSMFNWYGRATWCIAFLADLVSLPGAGLATETDLKFCRWFTRGWTLQELLAPKEVEFYDNGWNPRGTRKELCVALSRITEIDSEVLQTTALFGLPRIPVATRMSWAATRQTTRIEDRAYCLLGIFGVHMPLLYGERSGAFVRLQEAIAQKVNDMSLFAWVACTPSVSDWTDFSGLLASDLSEFASCTGMEPIANPLLPSLFWTMTNAGLEATTALDRPGDEPEYTVITRTAVGALEAVSRRATQPPSPYRLLLHCRVPRQHHTGFAEPPVLAIWLRKTNAGFVRHKPSELCTIKSSAMKFDEPALIRISTVIRRQQVFDLVASFQSRLGFTARPKPLRFNCVFNVRNVRLDCKYHPPHLWDRERLAGVEFRVTSSVASPHGNLRAVEVNISSLPGTVPFSRTCWLVCGVLGPPRQSPWAELVCEEADGSVPLLGGQHRCHRSVLTNPFALFGLSGTLVERGITPGATPLSAGCTAPCTPSLSVKLWVTAFLQMGDGKIRTAFQASIMAEQLDH